MSIVSFAQNFEDVMLWRALGHVKDGFYIDVGAQHPVMDSVSKAFYEKGWRGIHVEATPGYANLLRQDRPDETVLQVALAGSKGILTFYEIPETGLSTGDAQIARAHDEKGFAIREITVPSVTLMDVFNQAADRDIHWLKIDVEGMEQQVLQGWGESEARPWVVVVESTLPLTQHENQTVWESLLLARGYTEIYFDGLNRFYFSEQHPELAAAFNVGPNIFDGFALYGETSAPFCSFVKEKHRKVQEGLQQELEGTRQQHIASQQQHELLQQKLTQQVREVETASLQLSQRLADESHAYSAKERVLQEQILAVQTEQIQLERKWGDREKALISVTAQAREKSLGEQVSLLRALAQREQVFAQQLLELQQQYEREKIEQINTHTNHERTLARQHAEQERVLLEQMHAVREEMRQLKRENSELERTLIALEAEANLENKALQQTMAEREKAFSEQLIQVINASSQEKAELGRLYWEQEHSLRDELAAKERVVEDKLRTAQEAVRQSEQEFTERKAELSRQFIAAQDQFTLEKFEIESEFERHKECLIKENLLRCDVIRSDLSSAEQALARMTELSDSREEKHNWEALSYIEQIQGLQKFIAKNEEKRLREEVSYFGRISPLALNIPTIARIHNLIAILDVKAPERRRLSRIVMNSQMTAQIKYQPTFEQNPNGIYDLNDFKSLYDRNFVHAAYVAILRREPDLDGENHYLRQVRMGVGKDEILSNILKSNEAKRHKTYIRGLRSSMVLRSICRLPVLGHVFFAVLFLLNIKNHLQDLRVLENHVIRIAEESQESFRADINHIRRNRN